MRLLKKTVELVIAGLIAIALFAVTAGRAPATTEEIENGSARLESLEGKVDNLGEAMQTLRALRQGSN